MAVSSWARVMRRAHSSRNCVRFWRRCATSSRSSTAVDSSVVCGSSWAGAGDSFPLATMARILGVGMLLPRNSKASAQKTATGVAAYHGVRKEVANGAAPSLWRKRSRLGLQMIRRRTKRGREEAGHHGGPTAAGAEDAILAWSTGRPELPVDAVSSHGGLARPPVPRSASSKLDATAPRGWLQTPRVTSPPSCSPSRR